MINYLDTLRQLYIDQPHEVSIETLAICNAACTFCPYPTLERQGTRMPLDLIHSLIDQMSAWKSPFYISPFKVNEPLLDVRLIGICERINRVIPRAKIRLFTNGSPLTDNKISDIAVLLNVEHLWISLNSHEPDVYQRLMSIPFERTAHNLDRLHKAVETGEFRHPICVSKVSNAVRPGYSHEDYAFERYCLHRWPYFNVRIIKQDGWLGYVPPASPEIPDSPCVRWFELSILATGKVALCCMDGKGEYTIGDVNTHSLLDIYNSPYWRDRRQDMISRRQVFPCSTCTY